MGEIIQLQVGRAGHRIGYSIWEELIQEHHLDQEGKLSQTGECDHGKLHVFFREDERKCFRARSIFADMQPHSINQIYESQLSSLFPPQNSCYDVVGTRNLWAIAHQSGSIIKQEISDTIRKEVEHCDRLNGFSILHSACGGSGSGLASLILQNLYDSYNSEIIMPITGMPSPNISNVVVEHYNALLTMHTIINLRNHPSILFDNEALLKIQKKKDSNHKGNFTEVNKMLAIAYANLTSPSRFPCDGNVGLKKMAQNLLEFPNQKFLTISMPSHSDMTVSKCKMNNILMHQLLMDRNWSVSLAKKIVPKYFKHKWVANYFVFRGDDWSSFDVNWKIEQQFSKKVNSNNQWRNLKIVKQISHSFLACVVKSAAHRPESSLTSIQNSSMIRQFLTQFHDKISKMIQYKAFLHHYTTEGMQLEEFNEAQSCLLDAISEYQNIIEQPECYQEEMYYE